MKVKVDGTDEANVYCVLVAMDKLSFYQDVYYGSLQNCRKLANMYIQLGYTIVNTAMYNKSFWR